MRALVRRLLPAWLVFAVACELPPTPAPQVIASGGCDVADAAPPPVDARPIDAAPTDALADAMPIDAGSLDASAPDAGAPDAAPPHVYRLLYAQGDSVLAGYPVPLAQQPLTLLAATYPGVIFGQAVGGRTMDFYDSTAARIAYVVPAIASHNPSEVWLESGYNDWSGAVVTAADFGARLHDYVVAIHAAVPAALIYCQSPTDAHDPTHTNAKGERLSDFRAAEQAACAGIPGATYVDGLAFVSITAADHFDSVHLVAAGYAKTAAAIRQVVGW